MTLLNSHSSSQLTNSINEAWPALHGTEDRGMLLLHIFQQSFKAPYKHQTQLYKTSLLSGRKPTAQGELFAQPYDKMQGQSQEPRNHHLILTEKKPTKTHPKAKPVASSQSSLAESPLWWRMPAGTYSGGAILLRSTSLRKSLCRACSAVQRLPGSSVSMWSSRSRADEGMLRRELEIWLS